MKYFRSYPWGMQLLLFVLMTFTLLSAAGVIIPSVLYRFTGFTAQQLTSIGPSSPPALVNVMVIAEGIGNLIMFCATALLFAYLTTPRPAEYLGMRMPGKKIHLLLAVLVILGAMPIMQFLAGLIGQINFSDKIKASQKENDDMFNAFMNIHSLAGFLKIFVLLALIPGIGEELFFRGLLMRFVKKRSNNMVFPVLFTAVIFAYSHANIYGFLSIFLAGILLAVIYNLTGSIWCSMLAHVFFNGSQIYLSYLANNNSPVKAFMASNTVPYYLLAGGIVVFSISFYLLWKNRTPLPQNWTDDYTPEELSQKAY